MSLGGELGVDCGCQRRRRRRYVYAWHHQLHTDLQDPALYTRAFATKLFNEDPEEIVPVVLARAGYEKRMLLSDQGMWCIFVFLRLIDMLRR